MAARIPGSIRVNPGEGMTIRRPRLKWLTCTQVINTRQAAAATRAQADWWIASALLFWGLAPNNLRAILGDG